MDSTIIDMGLWQSLIEAGTLVISAIVMVIMAIMVLLSQRNYGRVLNKLVDADTIRDKTDQERLAEQKRANEVMEKTVVSMQQTLADVLERFNNTLQSIETIAREISSHEEASSRRDVRQEELLQQVVSGSNAMSGGYDELKQAVENVENKLDELLQREQIDSEDALKKTLADILAPLQTKLDSLLELLQPKPKEKEEEKSNDA